MNKWTTSANTASKFYVNVCNPKFLLDIPKLPVRFRFGGFVITIDAHPQENMKRAETSTNKRKPKRSRTSAVRVTLVRNPGANI